MGRLAGYSPRWEAAYAEYQKKAREHQRRVDAVTPVAHPPAGRRQLALLSYVSEYLYGRMTVGRQGHPPLTADMRALLRKKYLVMQRVPASMTVRMPLCNSIAITPAGRTVLSRGKTSEADKTYIQLARNTWVMR
jgi:hypothetical protein